MSGTAKVLTVGTLMPAQGIHPREAQDALGAWVLQQVLDSPLQANTTDEPPTPRLLRGAPERQTSAGAPRYIAEVKSGITFSDGTPLTAQEIARSLSSVAFFDRQVGVEVTGNSVVFTLKREFARLDLLLTHANCGIYLERNGRLLGTGAFEIAADATPEHFRLTRNPRYAGDVSIDEVVFKTYPPDAAGKPEALMKALESGEVDLTSDLSREDVEGVTGVRKSIMPGTSTAILYFNTEKPALANADVRRGMALALDRLELAGLSYSNALAFAASGILPRTMTRSRDSLHYDLAGAEKLLASAGKPSGLRLMTTWGPRPHLPHPRRISEAIAEKLAQVGVHVDVYQPRNRDEYFHKTARGSYDMVLSGWIADTADPADYLESQLSSRQVPDPENMVVSGNVSRYKSEAFDTALDNFRRDPSADSEAIVYELLSEQVPLFPIMYGPTIYASTWRLKGFKPSPKVPPLLGALSLD